MRTRHSDEGRLRQTESVINSRRVLPKVRNCWYTVMLVDFYTFGVAVSRIVVNHTGLVAPRCVRGRVGKGGIRKDRAPHLYRSICCDSS